MGGLRVLPDYAIDDYEFHSDVAMLIIAGGMNWGDPIHDKAVPAIRDCFDRDIPVAAICDATTFLGRHGYLDRHKHTGNQLAYLKQAAPNYRGEALYVEAQSVSDGGLTTANGSAAVEFGRHILEKLQVLEGEKLEEWYAIFKKGYLPAE